MVPSWEIYVKNVEEILDSSFQDAIKEGVVVVDFWAPWCAPCRMIAPILEELQAELADQAKIVKLNVDENPQMAQKYGITSIPTLLVFKEGQMLDRNMGASTKEHYKSLIEKHLA